MAAINSTGSQLIFWYASSIERTQPVITINNAAVSTDNTAGTDSIDKRMTINAVIPKAIHAFPLELTGEPSSEVLPITMTSCKSEEILSMFSHSPCIRIASPGFKRSVPTSA
jgi:hypothetical protein